MSAIEQTEQSTQEVDLVACQCCGGSSIEHAAKKRGFNIVRCSNCGLFFVHPAPTSSQLEELYSGSTGYFSTAEHDLKITSSSKARSIDDFIRSAGKDGGRLLDVGCSTGSIIYHLQELGWETYGVDLNADAIKIAKQNHLNVQHGTIEECNFPDQFFDAVHLGDLIEHVASPNVLIQEIHRILKPGGILSIITPNSDCGFSRLSLVLSRLFGMPWAHSEAPYHLFEFAPKPLTRLLSENHFHLKTISFKNETPFSYLVGNTGDFDNLKRNLKSSGHYKLNRHIFRYIPRLVLVASVLFPIWIIGKASDAINATGRSMVVAAVRE